MRSLTASVAVIAALVVAASVGCSPPNPPTAPALTSPVQAGFEGVWAVDFTLDGCNGDRNCVHFRGQTRSLYLRLQAVGTSYEGVADVGFHVPVSGTVDLDGSLTLSGRRPPPVGVTDGYDVEIDAITLRPTGSADGTSLGDVRYTTHGPVSSHFFGTSVTYGPVSSIEQTALLGAAPFSAGTWTGELPVVTCEAEGWTHCYPWWDGTAYPVTLDLSAGATGASGTLKIGGTTIPVAGSGFGSTIQLDGTASRLGSGVTTTYEVEADALTADRVGRLSGSFRITATFAWHDGRGTWRVHYPSVPLYAAAKSSRVN